MVKLIAGQLAVSLDNAQLYAELATSRARIVAAADEARRRIERDLHDGAQQRFVHTIITLKMARGALAGVDGEARSSSRRRSRTPSARRRSCASSRAASIRASSAPVGSDRRSRRSLAGPACP